MYDENNSPAPLNDNLLRDLYEIFAGAGIPANSPESLFASSEEGVSHNRAQTYFARLGELHAAARSRLFQLANDDEMWGVTRLGEDAAVIGEHYFEHQEAAERCVRLWKENFPYQSVLITHRYSADLDMNFGVVGRARRGQTS